MGGCVVQACDGMWIIRLVTLLVVLPVIIVIGIALNFIHFSNPIDRPHAILILKTPHFLTIKQHLLRPKLPIIKNNTFQLPILMPRYNKQTQRLLRIY